MVGKVSMRIVFIFIILFGLMSCGVKGDPIRPNADASTIIDLLNFSS